MPYKLLKLPGTSVDFKEAPALPMDQNLASILLLLTSEAVSSGSLILEDFVVTKTPTHISLVAWRNFETVREFQEIRIPACCHENISGTLANFLVTG